MFYLSSPFCRLRYGSSTSDPRSWAFGDWDSFWKATDSTVCQAAGQPGSGPRKRGQRAATAWFSSGSRPAPSHIGSAARKRTWPQPVIAAAAGDRGRGRAQRAGLQRGPQRVVAVTARRELRAGVHLRVRQAVPRELPAPNAAHPSCSAARHGASIDASRACPRSSPVTQ
jgi:hypothetical protein